MRCRCALGIPQDQAQLVGVFGAALFTMQRFGTGLMESFRQDDPELLHFVSALAQDGTHRVLRTAVYAVATPCTVPQALLHNLRHKQVRMSAT